MKPKFLFYGAIAFFIAGCNSQDDTLYFFFATHLFSLALCLYYYRRENRSHKQAEETSAESDAE